MSLTLCPNGATFILFITVLLVRIRESSPLPKEFDGNGPNFGPKLLVKKGESLNWSKLSWKKGTRVQVNIVKGEIEGYYNYVETSYSPKYPTTTKYDGKLSKVSGVDTLIPQGLCKATDTVDLSIIFVSTVDDTEFNWIYDEAKTKVPGPCDPTTATDNPGPGGGGTTVPGGGGNETADSGGGGGGGGGSTPSGLKEKEDETDDGVLTRAKIQLVGCSTCLSIIYYCYTSTM